MKKFPPKEIRLPVFYSEDEKGYIAIDEDEMTYFFGQKLADLVDLADINNLGIFKYIPKKGRKIKKKMLKKIAKPTKKKETLVEALERGYKTKKVVKHKGQTFRVI